MPNLAWTERAVSDLTAIINYISDINPDAADALLADIERKVAALARFPKRARYGRVEGTRELVVRPNYLVIYSETPVMVKVLRVLHAAQKWP
jgi:addiction module RelE/StbE family toxin